MKKIFYLLLLFPFSLLAQNNDYTLRSYKEEGMKAPNTHYIGEAWLNGLIRAEGDLNYNITKATFKANSTLDWHKHSTPQILIIVEGEGYYQEKGKDAIIIKTGDVVKCDSGIEHWHASSKKSDVTYLAIYGGNEPTTWTKVLTQEAYDNVAKKLE
jgi:quercetin dioxygenase-like cupin family protein